MARALLVVVGAGLCWLLSAPAVADDCSMVTARIVAGVRGTTFDRKWEARAFELKHPNATGFSIYCGVPGDASYEEIPDAINVAWKDQFPPATYFDLIGRAGNVLTGVAADTIRQGAVRCHQLALADKEKSVKMTADGISYECDANSTNITIFKQPTKKP